MQQDRAVSQRGDTRIVRNNQHRTVRQHGAQGLGCVRELQLSGGLVQNHGVRVSKHDTCQRQLLNLIAGQRRIRAADDGIHALRQVAPPAGTDSVQRLAHLLDGCIRHDHREVIGESTEEDVRFLGADQQARAAVGGGIGREVAVTDRATHHGDGAFQGGQRTTNQTSHSRFTRTGAAHQGERLTAANLQVDTFKHQGVRRVAVGDVGAVNGVLRVLHGFIRHGGERFGTVLCTRLTLLLRQGHHTEHAAHIHEHDAQAAHVVVQHVGEDSQAENHDRGGRYGAPGSPAESHAGGAPEHAQNRRDPGVNSVHGEVQLADAHHAQLRGKLALVLTGEGVFAGGVNAQLTDRGGAANVLGQHTVEVTHALLGGLVACRHERQHLRHDEGKTGNHG